MSRFTPSIVRSGLRSAATAAALGAVLVGASPAKAEDGGFWAWFTGDYSLTLGGSVFAAPSFEGSDELSLYGSPWFNITRVGVTQRFMSRNDSGSITLIDTGRFQAGPAFTPVIWRTADGDLEGLDDVPFGVEVGAFAQYYPLDWLRLRGEVRQAIGSHQGLVADLAADAFVDVTSAVRVSAGPRVSFASENYFDAYYRVTPAQAIASTTITNPYDPSGGGINKAGFGGSIDWKVTDRLTTSVFAEYSRLLGKAADSSIVKEIGSPDQFVFGLTSTYRFDFSL